MGCREIAVAHSYGPYLVYKVSYQTTGSCLQQLRFAPHSTVERPISALISYTAWVITSDNGTCTYSTDIGINPSPFRRQ